MLKKFSLKGHVKSTTLSMDLINLAMSYNLKAYPENINSKNEVEVIVEGNKNEIVRFYEHVKRDIKASKKRDRYVQGPLVNYTGDMPDWTFVTIKFMIGQLRNGAFEYFRIKKLLEKLIGNMK
jgi:acylphosphatase